MIKSKKIHAVILAILFSIINWTIIDNAIVEISFLKWILIEIILGFSLKLYNFIVTKYINTK